MADLTEYKSSLEYIAQLYTILLADYTARAGAGASQYKSVDLAKTVPGLAKVGTKLRAYFLADAKAAKPPRVSAKKAPVKVAPIVAIKPLPVPKGPPTAVVPVDPGLTSPLASALQERLNAEPALDGVPGIGTGVSNKDTYLFYLAGASVTPSNYATFAEYLPAMIADFNKQYAANAKPGRNMGDLVAFTLGTGDATLITRAQESEKFTGILESESDKFTENEDPDTFAGQANDMTSLGAFMAGYGITEDIMRRDDTLELLQAVAAAHDRWENSHPQYVKYTPVKEIAAFIAGIDAVSKAK